MTLRPVLRPLALSAAVIAAAGCAGPVRLPQLPHLPRHLDRAPPPARAVDLLSFYSGTWYVLARTPSGLTRGCAAERLDFSHTRDGGLQMRDSCRMGGGSGREKAFTARAEVIDPPTDADLRTEGALYGGLARPARTLRVLDHGDEDGGWFVGADLDLKDGDVLTRAPQPTEAARRRLLARAKALGLDVPRLEFPPHPPG